MTTKQRPQVGDKCWLVEWCVELAFEDNNPENGVDHDNCKLKRRQVATKEEAENLAKEVYPQTTNTFGVVEYWPAVFTAYDEGDAIRYPFAGYWKRSGDYEFYEGEV